MVNKYLVFQALHRRAKNVNPLKTMNYKLRRPRFRGFLKKNCRTWVKRGISHQLMGPLHGVNEMSHLLLAQNRGKPFGFFGPNGLDPIRHRHEQHVPVKKQNGVERLILRGDRHLPVDGQ